MDNNINQNVVARLKDFVRNHPEDAKSGFIVGLDPTGKVVINVNGEKRKITIDELENGHLNKTSTNEVSNIQMQAQQPVSNQMSAPAEEIEVMQDVPQEKIEVMEEPSNVVPFPSERVSNNLGDEIMIDQTNNVVQFPQKNISTLKDFQDAVIAKDEASVNKALETFAIDSTGAINMNKALKTVTDNCEKNVVDRVRDNTSLSNDLSKYDVMGKFIGSIEPSQKEDLQSLIDKSFEIILIYVEAARLKNIVYTPQQIEAAKKKYATAIQDKLNVLGLNNKDSNVIDLNDAKARKEAEEKAKAMTLDLQPDKDIKKAGFADILILTIIVLIYAAIIINLITKLK